MPTAIYPPVAEFAPKRTAILLFEALDIPKYFLQYRQRVILGKRRSLYPGIVLRQVLMILDYRFKGLPALSQI